MKTLEAIQATVRQLLRDEFEESQDYEFADDELEIHISEVLIEVSQRRPYEVKETVESDGTKEVDISEITDLLEVEKVEYPVGSDPPSFEKFSIFGNTLRIEDTTPTSGEDIYLYCRKVHQLTDTTSTLSPDLEKVLIEGAVAKAAMSWLNKMRAQIVPQTYRWYHDWAAQQFAIYQNSLNQITRPRVWEF